MWQGVVMHYPRIRAHYVSDFGNFGSAVPKFSSFRAWKLVKVRKCHGAMPSIFEVVPISKSSECNPFFLPQAGVQGGGGDIPLNMDCKTINFAQNCLKYTNFTPITVLFLIKESCICTIYFYQKGPLFLKMCEEDDIERDGKYSPSKPYSGRGPDLTSIFWT